MGATRGPHSRAEAAELADLRRRAYGPGADIHGDVDAISRLAELEAQLGHGTQPMTGETAPSVRAAEPVIQHIPSDPTRTARPTHRRAAVISAATAAIACGAVVWTLTAGPTDETLYPRADVPWTAAAQLSRTGDLDYLGITPSDARLYDSFRGFHVWSAHRGATSTCLFVTSATPPRWRVDCAPRSGEPMIDLVRYRDASRLAGFEAIGDAPSGSVLRLVLRNGVVVVQIVAASDSAGRPR